MVRPIQIIQGGQWGSEAKGMVALALCEKGGVEFAVRTGSINAGHTVCIDGKKLVFQQIPVGSLLSGVTPVLGPGAYVSPELLKEEVDRSGCAERLVLDYNCGVHLPEYTDEAREAGRNLKIGATGKGCAEAIIHKIKDRGIGEPLLLRHTTMHGNFPLLTESNWRDTAELLTDAYHDGKSIQIEGTQGSLLDLHTGPYPYTTSRQTISSAWVAEAGLSPSLGYEVVLVVRTFPIRVAGNSGPMPGEITWPLLARRMNSRLSKFSLPPIVNEEAIKEFECCLDSVQTEAVYLKRSPEEIKLVGATEALNSMSDIGREELRKLFEFTTVTKRLRRIADLDVKQLRLTVKKENPAFVVLTFLNYVFPELPSIATTWSEFHTEAKEYVWKLEKEIDCCIRYVTIGPESKHLINVQRY